MIEILLATHNPGKRQEYAAIFDGLDVKLITLDDAGITAEVEETGTTFEENARLKAESYMQISGLPTLADDSGLEIAILGGEPGIYSARYGGLSGRPQLDYLLSKLEGVPFHERLARFVCVIALARPNAETEFVEGMLHGVIETEPRGSGGFGYDPIFFSVDYNKTLAELSLEEKNAISHRSAAARAARPILARWLADAPC